MPYSKYRNRGYKRAPSFFSCLIYGRGTKSKRNKTARANVLCLFSDNIYFLIESISTLI